MQRGFYRIASLLGEPLSLRETYDAAAQAAAEALGGEFSAVLVRSPGGLGLVGGHALPPAVRSLELPRALDAAALEGHLLAASRISDDERFDGQWREAPFAALLAIPVGGETPGLVLVFFVEERDFARDDLELAHQVAAAATGALDRSRLFEAERTARSLSQQLARTGSLLATELDPAAVLEAVVTEAASLLDADAAALAALEGEELVVTAADRRRSGAGARRPLAGDRLGRRRRGAVARAGRLRGHGFQRRACRVGRPALARPPRLSRSAARGAGGRAARRPLRLLPAAARLARGRDSGAAALAANGSVALSNAELYQSVAVEREQSVAILANIADGIVAVDREGKSSCGTARRRRSPACLRQRRSAVRLLQVLQRDSRSEDGGMSRRSRSRTATARSGCRCPRP